MNNFYGRRIGRPLSLEKRVLIKQVLPTVMIKPAALGGDILDDLSNLFPHEPQQFLLEIGYGAGEHLTYFASENPNWGIIGAEPFINGIGILLKNIKINHLDNIRLWNDDVNLLLPHLTSDQFDQIVILFPDPWSKSRHHKRRLIQQKFIKRCCQLLKIKGQLIIATDHQDYLEWMIKLFKNEPQLQPNFDWLELPSIKPYPWPLTNYEAKAYSFNHQCHYLNFTCVK